MVSIPSVTLLTEARAADSSGTFLCCSSPLVAVILYRYRLSAEQCEPGCCVRWIRRRCIGLTARLQSPL